MMPKIAKTLAVSMIILLPWQHLSAHETELHSKNDTINNVGNMAKNAIEICNTAWGASWLSTTYQNEIYAGSWDEDNNVLRCINHGYNPITATTGGTFTGGQTARDYSIPLWDDMTDAFASGHLTGGDGVGAYHYLGRCCHLLQDVTTYVHIHPQDITGEPYDYINREHQDFESAELSDFRYYDFPNTDLPLLPTDSVAEIDLAKEKLDSFSANERLPKIFTNNDIASFIEQVARITYFRSTFWGEVQFITELSSGPAAPENTTGTSFGSTYVISQPNVLRTMFGVDNVRYIGSYTDDYFEITDTGSDGFKWKCAGDDTWFPCAGSTPDGHVIVGGSDPTDAGVRTTGRFHFARAYDVDPLNYPDGTPFANSSLGYYISKYSIRVGLRYNAALMGVGSGLTRTLTIQSQNPSSGVSINVSPADKNGQSSGTTSFTRIYNYGSAVSLTAPATTSSNSFQKWLKNGTDYSTNLQITVGIGANDSYTAVYVTSTPTRIISLNGIMVFGSVPVGSSAGSVLTIHNNGNSPMTVSGITYPNCFSGNWSGTIAASDSHDVTVTFAPTAAISYGGSVTVNSNATSGTNTILASGTGTDTQVNYTITVSASPSSGGTVSGEGTFASGSPCTVTATANSGYSFNNWTENGSQVSTLASFPFTVTASRNLVANFTQTQQTAVTNGGFESSWTPWVHSGGATIGSDGTAHTGSYFLWLGGDNGTDTAYQDVPIPSTATAANLSFYYNINSSEPISYGAYDTFSVTIRDTINSILATVDNRSNLNGTPRGNPYYYQKTFDLLPISFYAGKTIRIYFSSNCHLAGNLTTNFRVDDVSLSITNPTTYSISVSPSPSIGGTVSGDGTFVSGSWQTVTATANSGYSFVNWTENGIEVSTLASYPFTLNSNRNLVANFTTNLDNYTLTVNSSGVSGVSISSSTDYDGTTNYTKAVIAGTRVTLTAPSTAGGRPFIGWTGDVTNSNQTISFSMNGAKTVTANYDTSSYTLAVNSSGASGVSINSSTDHKGTTNYTRTVSAGTSVSLTSPATASGHMFVGWTGDVPNSNQTISFSMNGNRSLTANFVQFPINVDLNIDGLVDTNDLLILANQWLLTPETPSADLLADGIVNFFDFALFASHWFEGDIFPDITWVSIDDSGAGMKDYDGNPITQSGFTGQMSKYETTNAQYCKFLNAAKASNQITIYNNFVYVTSDTSHSQPYYNLAGLGYTYNGATNGGVARIHYVGGIFIVDSGFENHPVTFVSWYGATAFCNYYGYRLPTEWEWQAVADYDGSYIYGCGTSINNSIANYFDSTHPDGTTVVGAFGTYGYGMCDMAGNVWEWTSSIGSGSYRASRGGNWYHYVCSVSESGFSSPESTNVLTGFRVCRDVNPNGMVWVSINDPGVSGHEGFTGQMSKYETTNAQYCRYLNAAKASNQITVYTDNKVYAISDTSHSQPYFNTEAASSDSQITYSDGTFSVRNNSGYSMANHPVVRVSWYGATAFCNYYGYRLPTEWEWQAVADYDGSYTYGCGTTISQSKANYYTNGAYANPLNLTNMPYTSPVDYYPVYGYGMCDMAGNVFELTSTVSGNYRIKRGGSWNVTGDSSYSVSYRSNNNPSLTYDSVGFRVCR